MVAADSIAPAVGLARAGAFPSDPALPHLVAAVDPDVMRGIFVRHLGALGLEGTSVEDCRVDRVRYRRGQRCLLQYALRLRDARTGRTWRGWVSGGIYAGNRTGSVRGRAGTPTFLPELGMVVHVYPDDRKLPSLARLATAPPPELATVLLRELGPGPWEAPQWTIETVRYRAELGATLRYAVQARQARSARLRWRCFFVKIYAGAEAAVQSHAALRALWERVQSRGTWPLVPRPVAFLPGLHAIAQEEASGVSLEEVLTHGGDPERAAGRVARALATFHLDDVTLPRQLTRADEAAALARAARLIGWACPDLAQDVSTLTAAVAAGIDGQPLAPTHGDPKIDHVLLDRERVTFLDVDGAAAANPLLDLGTLLADMARLRLRGRLDADRGRAAARALVEEYFRCAPRHWRRYLPLACARATLDRALHFFGRQEPGWREHVRAMVGEARDVVAGRLSW